MSKIRIYELAKSMNMTNKALIEKLGEMGVKVKSHMSSIDEETAEKVRLEVFGKTGKKTEEVEQKRVGTKVIRKRRRRPVKEEETAAVEVADASDDADGKATADKAGDVAVAEPLTEEKKAGDKDKAALKDEQETLTPGTQQLVSEDAKTAANVQAEPSVDSVEDDKARVAEAKETPPKKKAKPRKHAPAKIIKLPDAGAVPLAKPAVPAGKGAGIGVPVEPVEQEPLAGTKPEPKGKKLTRKERKKKGVPPAEEEKLKPKRKSFKRREIIEGGDLYDRGRTRGRKKLKGTRPQRGGAKTQITTPKAIKRKIRMDESISVAELAKRMGVKASEIIARLMELGVMATMNQQVDFESAAIVASEFGYEVERASATEEELLRLDVEDEDSGNLVKRPPVITIMGHVDHGKTSLLDVIRESRITEGEAGGITQHIGAYKVDTPNGEIVFLDTPGHEAFTAMRARGASVTDIVILVVAADDGVMPQTIEAINHAKAADVPIVVAVNKIDKDGADPERVKREISEHGLIPEDWGGDTMFVNVSAKQKIGIDELLDAVLLQAELLELKANPDKKARGIVIESRIDPGMGPVATVLVKEGTLVVGDAIVCGVHYGKVRSMLDDKGSPIDKAGPSMPVKIMGLAGVVAAGDELVAVDDEKSAKSVSQRRLQKQRAQELAKRESISLENFFEKMQTDEVKSLNVIIKADVKGSCEAIEDSLKKFSSDEVKIEVVHSAPGTIIESDVSLASASNAIILGFNVRPSSKVRAMAKEEQVDIRTYDVIYDLLDDIKMAVAGMMESRYEEDVLGRAEVRELFVIPKKGTVAGSFVLEGKIERGQNARILRDGVVIYNGKIGSLRRFKDDAREVASGYECGIGIENYNDIKIGDIIECYTVREIRPEL